MNETYFMIDGQPVAASQLTKEQRAMVFSVRSPADIHDEMAEIIRHLDRIATALEQRK